MDAELVIIVRAPSGEEQSFRPSGQRVRVGRGDFNDLVLADPRVSRTHASFTFEDGVLRFENLAEDNPLLLNGDPRDRGTLGHGDVLQIGDTYLQLDRAADAVQTELEAVTILSPDGSEAETVGGSGIERARLALLSEIVNVLPREEEVEEFLDRVLASLFRIMDVRRAFVALRSDETDELKIVARRNRELGGGPFEVSQTILNRVITSREGLLTSNAMADTTLQGSKSVINMQIQSVICVPIIRGDVAIGALYGDNRARPRSFGRDELRFMTLISRVLSVLLENMRFARDLRVENLRLRRFLEGEQRIVGTSLAMQKLRDDIRRAASTDATILITGETGTGKNLVAQLIHELSRRAGEPFVEVSCAAIPETLLEAELFGYGPQSGISGAAPEGRPGRFEAAGEGSLLLDEIADMSQVLQAKILQALEARKFSRLGSNEQLEVRCRIVAATNRKLKEAVADGSFRSDLYYRLRVIPLHIPPLRERPEDILPIAVHLLRKNSPNQKLRLSPEARRLLQDHSWPGNVREVRNAIEHAVTLADRKTIGPAQLQEFLPSATQAPPSPGSIRTLEENTKEHVLRAMEASGGNKKRAAELLGISRSTLYDWLRKAAESVSEA